MQLRELPHERLVLVQQAQHLHEVHTYGKKHLREDDLGLGAQEGRLLLTRATVHARLLFVCGYCSSEQ